MPPSPTDPQPGRKPPVGLMIAVLFVVAALVLGYVVGRRSGEQAGSGTAAAGMPQATAPAPVPQAVVGGFAPRAPEDGPNTTLTGTVTKVGADGFSVSVESALEGTVTERAVVLGPDADVGMTTVKDAATYAADVTAWRAASATVAEGGQSPAIPDRVVRRSIGLSDIAPGMRVTVTSAADVTGSGDVVAVTVDVAAAPEESPMDETPAVPPVRPGTQQ